MIRFQTRASIQGPGGAREGGPTRLQRGSSAADPGGHRSSLPCGACRPASPSPGMRCPATAALHRERSSEGEAATAELSATSTGRRRLNSCGQLSPLHSCVFVIRGGGAAQAGRCRHDPGRRGEAAWHRPFRRLPAGLGGWGDLKIRFSGSREKLGVVCGRGRNPTSGASARNALAITHEQHEREHHAAVFRSREHVSRGHGGFPADRRRGNPNNSVSRGLPTCCEEVSSGFAQVSPFTLGRYSASGSGRIQFGLPAWHKRRRLADRPLFAGRGRVCSRFGETGAIELN